MKILTINFRRIYQVVGIELDNGIGRGI